MNDLKKDLKKSKLVFCATEQTYGIMSAVLQVQLPDQKFINIECQASEGDHSTARKCFRNFGKYNTGFYALKVRIDLKPWYYSSELKPDTVNKLFKLLSATIEKFNIEHVYPDCSISQYVEAFANMGLSLSDIEVNKQKFYAWKTRSEETIQ
jgi:hypothetical protein